MERQAHGFRYESIIIDRYNLIKCDKYTSEYDAYTRGGTPVQIKYIKIGSSIDLGDYRRNTKKSQDFLLIVGFWGWPEGKLIAKQEYILYIDSCVWKQLLYFGDSEQMFDEFSSISNKRSDDTMFHQFIDKYKQLWNQTPDRQIELRFKRDHKKQKRIQCAINHSNFYGFFLKHFARSIASVLCNGLNVLIIRKISIKDE
jgi:hypothetical protein